jgi:hypothetical protein
MLSKLAYMPCIHTSIVIAKGGRPSLQCYI